MTQQRQWSRPFGVGTIADFTGTSVAMDRRHCGFPCRVDLSCAYIGHSRAENLVHEALPHPVFPSPLTVGAEPGAGNSSLFLPAPRSAVRA